MSLSAPAALAGASAGVYLRLTSVPIVLAGFRCHGVHGRSRCSWSFPVFIVRCDEMYENSNT